MAGLCSVDAIRNSLPLFLATRSLSQKPSSRMTYAGGAYSNCVGCTHVKTVFSRRNMGSTSIVQLSAMLQEEWRRIPVDILHKLVESMPDRVAAVIATRGGTTRF
ncbi:hypothetical protein ANN_20812 [Periplaneta americana]|uniref:Uncharacterized protein n=1 Tax=Periplaneta americana TaxID=6978 RepID=A0ABQ8SEI4_PERAM|nr:hypothetical protein ANN_20812 [Periplaneta americana]